MRGAVLAQADRVMGEDVNHLEVSEGREADRRPHVIGEDEKRPAERDEAAVVGEAVQHRTHGVLAHAEVKIATGVTARGEVLRSLDLRVVRSGEVR
jgi:hypothetical protein